MNEYKFVFVYLNTFILKFPVRRYVFNVYGRSLSCQCFVTVYILFHWRICTLWFLYNMTSSVYLSYYIQDNEDGERGCWWKDFYISYNASDNRLEHVLLMIYIIVYIFYQW